MRKDEIRIEFSPLTSNVTRFAVKDGMDGTLWEDTLRLEEWSGADRFSREALGWYGFWLELKTRLGSRRPVLSCNDTPLLRRFHEKFRKGCLKPDDPWLFAEEM